MRRIDGTPRLSERRPGRANYRATTGELMTALIEGAEARLPESFRSALKELSAGSTGDEVARLVVVVLDPDDGENGWIEAIRATQQQHPVRTLVVVSPPAAMAVALASGAHEVISAEASTEEVTIRLRRSSSEAERRSRADGAHLSDGVRVAAHARRLITLGAASMGLAHDFNNLLTVILGNAAFLRDDASLDESSQRLLRDLEHSATRAGDLTEQILRYAASAEEADYPIDLNTLVRDVAPFLRALATPFAELRLALADAHLELGAEVSGMTQLLVNLVQNAAEAVPESRGEVMIRTGTAPITDALRERIEPSYTLTGTVAVFLEVEDKGHGMSPATVAQIFEPFFSTRGHGRGLGLSVVRDVARSHGGAIEVDSEVGRGTRVRVWLPAAAGTTSLDVSASAERWASRGLVLVADDEPEVRGLLRRILVTSGFQVLEAEDGDAALDLVDAHPSARLLMLDLTMPRLDGAEVVRRLTSQDQSLPVVMMSGYSFAQAKARLSSLEVAGFLKKPFLPGAVMAKVKKILGE